jgi:hypothetical protein
LTPEKQYTSPPRLRGPMFPSLSRLTVLVAQD